MSSHTANPLADDPARQPFLAQAFGDGTPSKELREMAPRKVGGGGNGGSGASAHGEGGKHRRGIGRIGIVLVTMLAFPTLLFVALSHGAADIAEVSSNGAATGAAGATGAFADGEGEGGALATKRAATPDAGSAAVEMPHELPTPDLGAGKTTLVEKVTAIVDDKLSGARHSVFEFSAKSLDGKTIPLSSFKSQVMLLVNVASKCGYTDVHYREMEQLYKKYKSHGFTVLAFPSNEFGNQEPGSSAEIEAFVRQTKKASFPLFEKVQVNGKGAHPLFVFLKDKFGIREIPWNFQKFLVDREGHAVHQYPPQVDPMALEGDLIKLLGLHEK